MIHEVIMDTREGCAMPEGYQICTRCVMDNTDPGVTFDEDGVCSSCTRYLEVRALSGTGRAKASGSLSARWP